MKLNSNDIAKAAVNKTKTIYQQKTGLRLRVEASKVTRLERSFVWC
jgi:hypothetical protein